MLSSLARRISDLERASGAYAERYVFIGLGETAEDALARNHPNGLPHNERVVFVSWQNADAEGSERIHMNGATQ